MKLRIFECTIHSSSSQRVVLEKIRELTNVAIDVKNPTPNTCTIEVTRGIDSDGQIIILDFEDERLTDYEYSTTKYIDLRNQIEDTDDNSFVISRVSKSRLRR